ncbi:MAG: porin [Cocleimonas sp.]|nr:porin [Cocleimonas sp.]
MNINTQHKKQAIKQTIKLKSLLLAGAVMGALCGTSIAVADNADKQKIKELEEKIDALAEAMDSQQGSPLAAKSKTHFGGYGELHYRMLDANGEKQRELDMHRMVLFIGHDFNDKARLVSEFEVEHIIASGGSRGAVEVEQVYVEMDLKPNLHLKTGVMLMPVGLTNETHEPPTFYGVERPIVESTIIPTTWWSAGMGVSHALSNGLSYDLMIHEGLKTEDPNSNLKAEPFNLKKGKQKSSFADGFSLAMTGRVKYTGKPGLELAAYAQYQPDLDQNAKINYADSATLVGGHVVYQVGKVTAKGLYARWNLAGDLAKAASKNVQDGGYLELDYKHNDQWGVFARQSAWSQKKGEKKTQSDIGVNFYPYKNIVFKADYQMQNADAGNVDGVSLGFGYQF